MTRESFYCSCVAVAAGVAASFFFVARQFFVACLMLYYGFPRKNKFSV